MKKKNEIDKNGFLFQDINLDDNTIKNKIFRYFYSLFQEKKEFNPLVKYFQICIEAFQIISYAFSKVHKDSWEGDYGIPEITEYVRISIAMKYFDYSAFVVLFYLLI